MLYWWKARHGGFEHAAWAGCGPAFRAREWEEYHATHERGDDLGGGAFGVRRPLRFLAYKLDLDDAQVGELARILNDLKTERAQVEVDRRRTVTAFADAIGDDEFDAIRAADGAALRVKSAERLRDAVLDALRRIHTLLDREQRRKLAYLIRTGALQI
jgi:Spy/CpxP family protein refolding chaperone